MRIGTILYLKSLREGRIIEIVLTCFLIFLSIHKNSFLPYTFIYIIFMDRIINQLWDNEKERVFFLQFELKKLRNILSIKQFIFLSEFNLAYFLIVSTLYYSGIDTNINMESWILMNLFLIFNLLFAIFYKGNLERRDQFKRVVRLLSFSIANIILILTIFFIKINLQHNHKCYYYFLLEHFHLKEQVNFYYFHLI